MFKFIAKYVPVFSKETCDAILDAYSRGERTVYTTLDMGLTYNFYKIKNGKLFLDNENIEIEVLNEIEWREGDLYCIENNVMVRLAWWRGKNYYKLRSVRYNTAPTLEINGIHMHRIKDISPWKDSLLKVKAISIRNGEKVLDIGTGLGYTAIISLQKGAGKVITVEKDLNVLEIASYNPWSRRLEDERIKIIVDDASKVIYSFSDRIFDKIIHDPPRFSLAGELYSLKFYRQLYRVLKPHGILFHYTGYPGLLSGKRMVKGMGRRLMKAGFRIEYMPKLLGILAYK